MKNASELKIREGKILVFLDDAKEIAGMAQTNHQSALSELETRAVQANAVMDKHCMEFVWPDSRVANN